MKSDLTLKELKQAYIDCRKNKRNTSAALKFEENADNNLLQLYNELISNTYHPGRFICFVVEYPKVREVWASNFRDRVVHHLIYNRYSQLFYNSFIHDSYACIPNKGTLAASKRVQHFIRSASQNNKIPTWYMKADVANFFMSINKQILDEILSKKITDPWWINLTRIILYHDPKNNVFIKSNKTLMAKVPIKKSLFHTPDGCGLPIGNLSSQFFANVYMNELDQYAKHVLKVKYYARYVDDIVCIDNCGRTLDKKYDMISSFAKEKLKLELHPHKKEINKVEHGINFVGYIIKPYCKYTRRSTIINLHKKVKLISSDLTKLRATVNSYFGMLIHTNSYNIRLRFTEEHQNLTFDNKLRKMILQ